MPGDTERVTMVWPKELKDAVRDAAGKKRSMTEFIIEAVEIYLKEVESRDQLVLRISETEYFAQLLADRLVMGGDSGDRLQALMEVEFPQWIDTTGWPASFAELVHKGDDPPLEVEVKVDVGEVVKAVRQVREAVKEKRTEDVDASVAVDAPEEPQDAVAAAEAPEAEKEVPAGELSALPAVEPPSPGGGEDLFARVMKQTGQDLSGVPGLKPASALEKPAPKEDVHNHSWKRIDGVLTCECKAFIDESDPAEPNGIVREPDWIGQPGGAEERFESLNPEPTVGPDLCPKCQEERIDGECWTCD